MKRIATTLAALAILGGACTVDPDDPANRAVQMPRIWRDMTPERQAEWCNAWNTDPALVDRMVGQRFTSTEATAFISVLATNC